MAKLKCITMTNLTPLQKRVLNTIKVFQAEYLEGIPYKIIKFDLNIPEENLNQILGFLEEHEHISLEEGIIILENDDENVQKVEDVPDDGSITETINREVEEENQLSETEQQSLEIIRKLVDDQGYLSRTLLEGNLLYGELELSNIKMYNVITSLENKNILKKIQLSDGEYYKFTP